MTDILTAVVECTGRTVYSAFADAAPDWRQRSFPGKEAVAVDLLPGEIDVIKVTDFPVFEKALPDLSLDQLVRAWRCARRLYLSASP